MFTALLFCERNMDNLLYPILICELCTHDHAKFDARSPWYKVRANNSNPQRESIRIMLWISNATRMYIAVLTGVIASESERKGQKVFPLGGFCAGQSRKVEINISTRIDILKCVLVGTIADDSNLCCRRYTAR